MNPQTIKAIVKEYQDTLKVFNKRNLEDKDGVVYLLNQMLSRWGIHDIPFTVHWVSGRWSVRAETAQGKLIFGLLELSSNTK